MSTSWAETYYMIASAAGMAGVISCGISITLCVRTKPDRLKARVEDTMKPLNDRVCRMELTHQRLERESRAAAEKHDRALATLDQDVSKRVSELEARGVAQHLAVARSFEQVHTQLATIQTAIQHGIQRREVDTLHHRVTEVAKSVAAIEGKLDGIATMAHNINDFLREHKP